MSGYCYCYRSMVVEKSDILQSVLHNLAPSNVFFIQKLWKMDFGSSEF